MKKSTIILLIAMLSLMAVTFVSPLFMLESADIDIRILKRTGENVRINTRGFVSLEIRNKCGIGAASDSCDPLYVSVSESDTICSPLVITDRSWHRNITVNNDSSTLVMCIDGHTDCKKDNPASTVYDAGNSCVAKVIVPGGTLRKIDTGMLALQLCGINAPEMTTISSGLELQDCSFGILQSQ